MAAARELPPYLDYREGSRPVVIVAPHGGRRARGVKRSDGINDIYTAELAHLLAERLDAYALVNARLDRNDIDLNRISEIVTRAPGMAKVLRSAVARAAASGRSGVAPLVLWVHGWNVSSLACDIGVGLRRIEERLVGAHPTVSPATFRGFVEPLCVTLRERDIAGFLGHRYPASARDNATQIFSGRHAGHANGDIDALSHMALGGAVDAVQLELSISLRWPGAHRERWLEALVEAVDRHIASHARATGGGAQTDCLASPEPARGWASKHALATSGLGHPHPAAGESVQAVLADGSGLFMGVEPAGARGLAARICVARPDGRLALFVCEAPWDGRGDRFEAGALCWRPGRAVGYAGPAVMYASHDAFIDLEQGLEAARVAEIEVAFEEKGGAGKHGDIGGYVRIDEETLEITAPRVRRAAGRFLGAGGVRARVLVAGVDGRTLVVEDRRPGGVPPAVEAAAEDSEPERVEGRIDVSADASSFRLSAPALAEQLAGRATVRVPVYRPGPDGGYVKVVFGVVEWTGAPRHGSRGLFEVVERFPPSR